MDAFDGIEIVDGSRSLALNNNELLDVFFWLLKRLGAVLEKQFIITILQLIGCLLNLVLMLKNISTDDLRNYLTDYKESNSLSKTTVDNVRRIFSSFFAWLEDEGYILKNPVKRIHRVKTPRLIKDTLSDDDFELMCSNCKNLRNLAIIEMLLSTGIRVGEIVNLDIDDVDFTERECIVFGKGDAERIVYFDARCKLHLKEYLLSRTDNNPALFVSLR